MTTFKKIRGRADQRDCRKTFDALLIRRELGGFIVCKTRVLTWSPPTLMICYCYQMTFLRNWEGGIVCYLIPKLQQEDSPLCSSSEWTSRSRSHREDVSGSNKGSDTFLLFVSCLSIICIHRLMTHGQLSQIQKCICHLKYFHRIDWLSQVLLSFWIF